MRNVELSLMRNVELSLVWSEECGVRSLMSHRKNTHQQE